MPLTDSSFLHFKQKKSMNDNRRKHSSNQQCLFFSFVTSSITYCAYQTFPMRHEGANLFVFGCAAYTEGKSFLFLSAEVVDSVLTPLHHACLPPPDIYAHKRQIIRKWMSGEASTITDAALPSVALSHNKTRRFLVTALSNSPSADDHFCYSL